MDKKEKSWFRRHWIISIILSIPLMLIIIGMFQGINDAIKNTIDYPESSESNLEAGKIIRAPDTKNVLFTLKGTEIVEGDCSTVKSFNEYGVNLPENCDGISSLDITNYCVLGNKKGENVNNYYCRPERYMKCKIVSSSGEVKDVKYYGITKVLSCNNSKEQLIDIQVRSCVSTGLGFDCS